MTNNLRPDNSDQKEKWIAQILLLWPAIKGSLAQVRKPCIRKHCPACAQGQKHPGWILSVVAQGRRSTLYVPEGLVAPLQQAIQNGRKIEKLLQQAAIHMVKNYRKQASKTPIAKTKS